MKYFVLLCSLIVVAIALDGFANEIPDEELVSLKSKNSSARSAIEWALETPNLTCQKYDQPFKCVSIGCDLHCQAIGKRTGYCATSGSDCVCTCVSGNEEEKSLKSIIEEKLDLNKKNAVWYACWTFDNCVNHPDSCILAILSGRCYGMAIEYSGRKFQSVKRQDVDGAANFYFYNDPSCSALGGGFQMYDNTCKPQNIVINGVTFNKMSYFKY